jgi:hypothetical protein
MEELTFIDPKTKQEFITNNYTLFRRCIKGRKITVATYTHYAQLHRRIKMFKIISDVPIF